jgi:uncharacterized membrane protein
MRFSPIHFFPLALPIVLALFFLVGLVIALVEIGVLQFAYEKMGVSRRYVFSILVLSLLGSYVNIPVAELPPERVLSNQVVDYFGMRYVVPLVQEWPRTVIAVNVGGAVVPTLLSLYLAFKKRLLGRALVGVTIVAALVHAMAHPVPGVGIAVPVFVPPLVAATAALLLAWRTGPAPALAYISGSLGTLVGADLLNLGRIQGLGAPVASIGGAGTFDGIFITGIVAVLLA